MVAHLAAPRSPGLAYALQTGDETVIEAHGLADVDRMRPLAPDSLFRILSLTKPITGLVTLMLAEDGVLDLDAPVDALLPELAAPRVLVRPDGPLDQTVPAKRAITPRDLVTCRMGQGQPVGLEHAPVAEAQRQAGVAPGAWPGAGVTADAWLGALAQLPLIHHPGQAWLYDTGLTVLGIALERASGLGLDTLFRERVFAPLGMGDTGFHVRADALDRLVACYRADDPSGDGFPQHDPAGGGSRFAAPPLFPSASMGLVSTVADYLVFARAMMAGGMAGGRRLISEGGYRELTRDHITAAQKARSPFAPGFWDHTGWGFGLAVRAGTAAPWPRGFGWIGGYGCAANWNPATGVIGVVMTQRRSADPHPPLIQDFWRQLAHLPSREHTNV